MPTQAVTQALTCLIPSLPASDKPFPPALVSQCESFLALSRQRASNLKPEEEIARAHACSEIACNRLRAQLRLPVIKNGARAPCQPRVYAKLVKFLEGVLVDASLGSSTPKGKKRDASGALKETPLTASGKKSATKAAVASDGTPSKKRAAKAAPNTEFLGSIGKVRKAGKNGVDGTEERAPDFTMPSIRKLCKLFATPAIAPHVYTGCCIVLGLSATWTPGADMDDDLKTEVLTLVTALYLMVLTRMQEGEMTTEVYTEVSSKSLQSLELSGSLTEKVEHWIKRLNDEGWADGQDWWASVPEGAIEFGTERTEGTADKSRLVEDDSVLGRRRVGNVDEEDPDGVLLPGLGTMLHSGNDWTSEEKCLDFKEWHAGILERLASMSKPKARRGKAIAVH